ncbi:MAG: D-amino acid aminotransferase [Pseudomonadales bacterium]|jgi:D-alanine transaminase
MPVYLNGAFMPIEEAQVSVLDRGFLFGDGVYEVIPVYQGKPLRLQEHLDRLQQSMDAIHLEVDEDWHGIIEDLVELNGKGNLSVYLQVTRGVMEKRDHAFPEAAIPTVFLMATPFTPVEDLEAVKGVKAVTVEDNRWLRCFIKSICLQPNVLLKEQASRAGAQDAILIRDGLVTEAAAANVFVVKQDVVYTAPKNDLILGGVTRDLIIELLAQAGIECQEQAPSAALLASADEVWITSSTREIVPVIELDGQPVGDGEKGAVWYNAMQQYQYFKKALIAGKP